jgi:hypothetical protein
MSSITFEIPLANGVHTHDIENVTGYHQIMLGFTQYPTAGRMAIEFQPIGVDGWFPIPEAQNLDLSLPRYAIAFGGIHRLRFTISGLSGGVGLFCQVITTQQWPGIAMPPGLFEGLRAMTVQNYTEANVKNGVQYEASSNTAALVAGASIDTIFITGAFPVLIKNRIVQFNGNSLLTRVYRAPSYTGGTPAAYFNMDDIGPVAGGVQILSGATVSAAGTEFGAPTYSIGSTDVGNSSLSTFSTQGVERRLRPNTAYLQRITNDSAATQRVTSYLSWFEGGSDLPRN